VTPLLAKILIEANFRSHYEGNILFPEVHARLAASGFVLTGLSPPGILEEIALWCDCLYTRQIQRGSNS
jgi:hypothetical protein